MNNSTAVLKTTGTLINREEFYPFGETSFGGFQFKRYRYNGKEKDEESGLYEYGQRYYAPWVCRFVSVDPVAEKFLFYTSYNYAGNKPVSKVDLEGLQENDAPQKIEPKSGRVQVPDAQPGIATFRLPTVEVTAVRERPPEANTSALNTVTDVTASSLPMVEEVSKNIADSKANYSESNSIYADEYRSAEELQKLKNPVKESIGNTSANNFAKPKGGLGKIKAARLRNEELKSVRKLKLNGQLISEVGGTIMDGFALAQSLKDGSSPFTALPLVGTVAGEHEAMMHADDWDILKMSINQGYEFTREQLKNSPSSREVLGGEGNFGWAFFNDEGLIKLMETFELDYKEYREISPEKRKHAALVISNGPDTASVVAIFYNIKK